MKLSLKEKERPVDGRTNEHADEEQGVLKIASL